jgi:PKD repeat protein
LPKLARRCTLALALSVALLVCAAPSALAAPTADFTVSAQPQAGSAVTFTSTSTTPVLTEITGYAWDFGDGTASAEQNPNHVFPRGTFSVTLTVTNNELLGNTNSVTKQVVVNGKPVADFAFNPTNPLPDQDILFASNSSDPDGNGLSQTWDFGDGSGPVTAGNPTHAYATPGEKTVRLAVSDGNGGLDDITKTVTVRDPSAAAASFDVSPANPVANQVVTFTSTSTPSNGQTITSQRWDLDSDGVYDDGTGGTATRRFDSPGVYRVALQVTQANGNDAVAEGTVRVGTIEQSPPPGQTPTTPVGPGKNPKAKPSLMSPFPLVRLRALAYRSHTRVLLLSVRGPRGSVAKVRCKGKGCPKISRSKRPKGHGVRFKTFERSVRAGASLEIRVIAKGRIGKYTRFKMRRLKPALRVDRCLIPGKKKPRPCPS